MIALWTAPQGGAWTRLPGPVTAWSILRTDRLGKDSFRVELADTALPDGRLRFSARVDGVGWFTGLADEVLCTESGAGRRLVLRGRGIIETAQGRDSRVARLNRVQDTSPLIHLFSTQPRTLYDLLDVRALLEGESARLAATLGTQADFVVITRCYEKMLAASENNKEISLIEHAQLDHAFHLAICQASHNQVLEFTLQSLTDLMFNSVFASVNNLYHRPQQKKQIDRQHARIYNAVLQRLPHVAQRAARDHVRTVKKNLHDIELEGHHLIRSAVPLEMKQG